MISRLFIILLIFNTACVGPLNNQSTQYLRGYFFGFNDDLINHDFYSNFEYSFAKIKFGRGPSIILVLAYISDNIFEWRSSDGVKIYTKDGIVIKTIGLNYDFDISNIQFTNNLLDQSYGLVKYIDPDFLDYNAKLVFNDSGFSTVKRFNKNLDGIFREYNLIVDSINFSGKVRIEFVNDVAVYTQQKTHPFLPEFDIEFFYK